MKEKQKNKSVILKQMLSLVLVFALAAAGIPQTAIEAKAETADVAEVMSIRNPTVSKDVTTWDCVWFGNYWQNDTNGNGIADQNDEKEPIRWRVLSVENGEMFLLSDKNLDCKKYDEEYGDEWNTCTLRTWLNTDFLDEAFSDVEQSAISISTTGNETQDKVFLLSVDEAKNTDYGFVTSETENSTFDTRMAVNTGFTQAHGATTAWFSKAGWWWLRTSGISRNTAGYVYYNGRIDSDGNEVYGNEVNVDTGAVRPALKLSISSPLYSYAGTVNSDELDEETSSGSTGEGNLGDDNNDNPDQSDDNNYDVSIKTILNPKSAVSAVITSNGSLYMWGGNRTIPTHVMDNVEDVCGGIALTDNGDVYDVLGSEQPTKIMEGASQIAVSGDRAAAITEDGGLYMWGSGYLGDGTQMFSRDPIKIMDDVIKVSLGYDHSAAITANGSLYTWGENSRGALGNGNTWDQCRRELTPIKVMDDVVDVILGYEVSAAITEDRTLYMWGDTSGYYSKYGGSGDGQINPEKMGSNVAIVRLSGTNRAFVTTDGTLYLWGDNSRGKVSFLIDDEEEFVFQPTTIEDYYEDVADVEIGGGEHIAMLKQDGKLYMWGYNRYGQTGTGYEPNGPTFIMDNVSQVSLGEYHSVTLTSDGELFSWGRNNVGQLGNGSTTDLDYPRKVKFFSILDKVESGDNRYTVLILDASGSMEGTPASKQRQAAIKFCETVFNSKAMNYIAVVEVNGSSSLLQDFTYDIDFIKEEINGLTISGGTDINGALKIVDQLLSKAGDDDSVKNIILCTDGMPESGDTSYSGPYNSSDYSGYTYANAAYNCALGMKSSYNIYTMGFLHSLSGSEYAFAERFLTDIQNAGYYSVTDPDDLESVFKEIASDLNADGMVNSFSLNTEATAFLNSPVTIGGKIVLRNNVETSSTILTNEINSIKWTSSDQSIVSDSEIFCTGVNSYDNRSAELMISFTPHKKGKVTITGTASNELTASCEVTVGGCITIGQKANDLEGCTIALSGTFTLEESTEASEANLQAAVDALKFESSDDSKAKVLACNTVQSEDHRSAKLEIWTTLYNEGEVTITAKAPDGHKAECRVTIQADTSEDSKNYEGDYTSEMRDFLTNKGTYNTLKYLCNSSNFTASTFVAEKDAKFGNLLVMALTDTYYRGWDGWKDIIDGSTSVEEAEKIIASLLNAYQSEVEGLSQAKTAQKYAKMINDAFSDYTKSTNMFRALKNEEIQAVRKYFSDENLTKLLYNGKYEEIVSPVNQILQMEGMSQIMQKSEVFQAGTEASKSWNKMIEGFTQSAEMSNIAKKGCEKKLGGLEVGGGIKDIGKILKRISLAQDTINYLYRLESLLAADEMYCEMLLYIQENCPYSVVQEAAGNLYSVINDGVEGIVLDVVNNAMNLGGEKAIDMTLDAACKGSVPFAMIKAGFDWGVTLSNTFFKVGTAQELKDSLRSQAFLANTLGGWALSNEMDYLSAIGTDDEAIKAKELYYSLYMVWESRKRAEETLQSLLKTTGGEWSTNYSVSTRVTSTLESFQNNIFSEGNMAGLFGISVSCPVDVEVCNAAGDKLLTVKDGAECRGYENGIYYYCVYNPLANDYDKYIYYSEESGYRVKILGNDLGSVDASVLSVNDDGYFNEFYIENTGIEKGTVIALENISKENAGYKIISSDGSEKSETMDIRKAEKIATHSISLSAESLELEVGKRQLLKVSFAPASATNQKVAWNSSNEAIVSVNSDGVITAIATGTAVVTAFQGDLEQTCKITVKGHKLSGGNTEMPSGGGDKNKDNELIAKKMILSKTSYVYNGKAKKPAVTVIDNKGNKISGAYYTVSYRNNEKVGKATVTVELKNGYFGALKKNFTIKPNGTKCISLTGKSKSISIKWAKQKTQTTGYQIQYSTNSKFSKKSRVIKTVKKNVITKLTVKRLKASKTYYVRIRTYKTVNGKMYYSDWSKVKKVKTKK